MQDYREHGDGNFSYRVCPHSPVTFFLRHTGFYHGMYAVSLSRWDFHAAVMDDFGNLIEVPQ